MIYQNITTMKKKMLFMLLSVTLYSCVDLLAQVGNPWLIGGNNLTASRSIGSNNNFGLIFKTNGIERARITATGLFGINTSTFNNPYRLKVSHTSFGLDIQRKNHDWELFTQPIDGSLQLYSDVHFRGSLMLLTAFIRQYQMNA